MARAQRNIIGEGRYRTIAVAVTLASALLGLGVAQAQTYPVRPIRMVVPWPPGGSNDVAARILAPHLSRSLGQQLVVDNRAGAGGTMGADIVAKAAADGYTIMLHSSTHVVNATLRRKLPYDTVKDFTLLALVASQPTMMVVHPSLPVNSVQDLIALAKAQPGRIRYGSGGNGSTLHMAGALFAKMAGINMLHVPYKGGSPAVMALLGGEVQLAMATVPTAIAHVKAGKLRALAVCSGQRSRLLPDLPTVAEAGVPGYEMNAWIAIFAPAGVPKSVIARLENEIQSAQKLPEVQNSFSAQGMELVFGKGSQLASFVETERRKFAAIIEESGARIE
ncbi:MAG: hypothetical protein A3G24_12435 [Betaproteobacteria bacterium RIFCSPLOWO2_12_FULL_62_13]|nr:MAG: hypothetical protein A3G24_12435 [Betaproteobacteria bacterium RIFCSPLOWO2_12_FULL_62_13]